MTMIKQEMTIGIPTFGREAVLIRTLEHVLAAGDPARMEVIVADQTPEHEASTLERLQHWHDEGSIRWLRLDAPSLTRARNAVLEAARSEIILFLDDDMIIPGMLFEKHFQAYDDKAVAAVTGQVYNCLDHRQPPSLDDPKKGTVPHSEVTEPCDAKNTSGGNHSVRRSVALAVGGYDANFKASALGEDLDFSRRLLRAGYRIRYEPEAWVIHLAYPGGGCGVTGSSTWPEWTHASGLCLYAFRHGFTQGNFGSILWMSVRNGPARKEIMKRPWRWPWAWLSWLRALAYGFRHRNHVDGVDAPGNRGEA